MATRFEQAENTRGTDTKPRKDSASPPEPTADFEGLLADLSAAFVRVSVDQIDNEIEKWLERIVLRMGIDRSTVVQIDPGDGAIYVTHQWAREGVSLDKPNPGQRVKHDGSVPWLTRKVLSGELVVFSRLEDLPPEASIDREDFRRAGNKSNVTIPVKVGGSVVGALLFGAILFEKHWTEQEVQRLKLVAEVLGNAFERKRAEAGIRRLSEELRRASQVMTMGELTASLAHELNQPLGAILNNAKTARRLPAAKTPDLAEIDAAVDDIVADDSRAVEIIRAVRAIFQRGEMAVLPADVRQLLLGVARVVSAEARTKRISWSMELPTSMPLAPGIQTHLTQAVLNLVMNAFDSVCDGDGPREVTLSARQDEPGAIHISVRDSGKGIDPNVMPRLFDPFFTTKATGMGMGLTIVRSIIENHGGRIWATQNPARGAHLFGDARAAEDVVSGLLRLGYQAKRREEGSESKSAGSDSTAARDEPRLYDFASSREFGEKVEVVRDHLQ